MWDNNPKIARPEEQGDFQEFRPRTNGLRPYCSVKTPERWTWKPYGPPVGEIYLHRHERQFANIHSGTVIVEPNLKNKASPNKDWGWDRWRDLLRMMRANGLQPVQLGPPNIRRIDSAYWINTENFRLAAAVMSTARVAVLSEGALHHAAAAFKIPAVVIFGGYISPEVTGYAWQRNLFVSTPEHPLGCGWRKPCAHCAEAMASITPEMVMAKLEEVLSVPAPRHLAA